MDASIEAYNRAQDEAAAPVCAKLALEIDRALTSATSKVWHGGPVWFLEGNPVVGYWVRKGGVQLLFWSGQSFDEPGLEPEGKFKAAQRRYGAAKDVKVGELRRWLRAARTIQWDYKNIAKRRGQLEKLGDW